jgi:hypothetical protein
MKHNLSLLVIITACVVSLAFAQPPMPGQPGMGQQMPAGDPNIMKMDPNTMLVTYGDQKLILGDVLAFAPQVNSQILSNMAKQWLDIQMLYDGAKAAGLTENHKAKFLADINFKQVFAKEMMNKAASEVNVPDQQMQEYYDKNKDTDPSLSEPNRYSFTHVQVKTMAEANDVLTKAKAGGDMNKFAKELSKASDAAQNGVVKKMPEQRLQYQYGQDFVKAISAASEGQVIGPIATKDGFEVVRHEGKLASKVKSFDEVKTMIKSQLEQKEKMAASENMLKALKEKYKDKITTAPIVDMNSK